MRRSASEVIRSLESRIARLEKKSSEEYRSIAGILETVSDAGGINEVLYFENFRLSFHKKTNLEYAKVHFDAWGRGEDGYTDTTYPEEEMIYLGEMHGGKYHKVPFWQYETIIEDYKKNLEREIGTCTWRTQVGRGTGEPNKILLFCNGFLVGEVSCSNVQVLALWLGVLNLPSIEQSQNYLEKVLS